MVERVIRWVGKDKMVKDELRVWEGQDYPGRGTEELEGGLEVGVGHAAFMSLP